MDGRLRKCHILSCAYGNETNVGAVMKEHQESR